MKSLIRRILRIRMEKLRVKMVEVGTLKGLTHKETVLFSQKLDRLMNRYNQFYNK